MLANVLALLHTIDSCMGTKGNHLLFFLEEGYDAHHIMQLKCLTYCTPLAFRDG